MKIYRLRCCAPWTSAELADLFALFRDKAVNVRRLLLVEAFARPSYTNMEIRFVMDGDITAFLETLQQKLSVMNCAHAEIIPLPDAA